MYEKTVESQVVFKGRLLTVEQQKVELESGTYAGREIVRHRGAVAVLARLPDARFVLVRQFRKPVEQELMEVVAGCLEGGEPPAACARREVREETGYTVKRLHALGRIYPTPGYCDEVLHLFYADLKPEPQPQRPDDDERVKVLHLSQAELEQHIASHAVRDAKTLAVWLRYEKSPWFTGGRSSPVS